MRNIMAIRRITTSLVVAAVTFASLNLEAQQNGEMLPRETDSNSIVVYGKFCTGDSLDSVITTLKSSSFSDGRVFQKGNEDYYESQRVTFMDGNRKVELDFAKVSNNGPAVLIGGRIIFPKDAGGLDVRFLLETIQGWRDVFDIGDETDERFGKAVRCLLCWQELSESCGATVMEIVDTNLRRASKKAKKSQAANAE